MSELKYKLIVADLDGTLLNSSVELSDRTVDAINRYQNAGGLFTYATGRSEESAKEFADKAGIKIPGISFNGGKVVSLIDGNVIYETFLDAEASKKAYTALRALNKNVIVYLEKSRHVAEYTAVIDRYLERIRRGVHIVRDIDAVIGDGRSLKKLLVIDPKQEGELILDTIRPFFGKNFNSVKSDPQFYEILPPGTTKGAALAVLANYLGVSLADTIAVGDHLNDVPMIQAAGLGVAVANAVDEALEAAGYVTASNNDDGVAQLIDKVLAGEL